MTPIPSDTALVLGGGGAKGAYQVGVFSALSSLGLVAGQVYGTSVGALNAAMYAQGSIDAAVELWHSIQLDQVVTKESVDLANDLEKLFAHPEKAPEFIARFTKHPPRNFVDITPLERLIRQMVNESLLRQSPVRLGLVATRFPDMAMIEKCLPDMEPGSLVDWLLASSTCFPIFPMKTIGKEHFIDGGFCDNVPVGMALRAGARHVIAVDIGKHPAHTQYSQRPNITYIRTSQPLGGLLTFDPAQSEVNEKFGYNDCLRAFGRVRGVRYSFDADDAQHLSAHAEDFVTRLSQSEARFQGSHALSMKEDAPFFSLLEKDLRSGPDAIDYFLSGCECLADLAQLPVFPIYTLQSYLDALVPLLPLEQAESMVNSLLGGRLGVLLSNPKINRLLLVTCLYQIIRREQLDFPLAAQIVSAFPRELVCALMLQELLS